MARESLIRLRESAEPGKIPTIEQLELAELAANTYDGRLYLKQQTEEFERIITIAGKVPVKNTIYIQKNGEDRNNGDSWDNAVLTFERALELAELRNNELTLIDVGPGEYLTQGHLDVPDNTLIRAAHRSVVIKPVTGYEERNVFRLGSGCFIEGPVFEGWRLDDLENPTEGFAVCFRPGALITRVPYVHKVVVRSTRYWDTVAPPLDRNNANPLIGRGGGVVLADGSVLSPYSIFPNIMTWGATPVSHNGIGYCAKNGGLINAVNAVSLWAHKHFYALDGGQIVLSSCSTQFGDYTLVSKGSRQIVYPQEIETTQILDYANSQTISIVTPTLSAEPLTLQLAESGTVLAAKQTIVDNLWTALVNGGYTAGWTASDETFTRRDAGLFLSAIANSLKTADESYMLDFARSLFLLDGTQVFSVGKLTAFVFSFNYMRDEINALVSAGAQTIVTALVAALNTTIQTPTTTSVTLSQQSAAATTILAQKTNIVNAMWNKLVADGYTTGWTLADETSTLRDGGLFINALVESLNLGSRLPIENFIRNLFYATGTPVFSSNKLFAFIASFDYMRGYINNLGINATSKTIVEGLTKLVTSTIYYPDFKQVTLVASTLNATTITNNKQTIIDNLWTELVDNGYTATWDALDEEYTRRDAGTFLQSIIWVVQTANEKPILDFAKGLFNYNGVPVFSSDKLLAFIFSFNFMRDQINSLSGISSQTQEIVTALVTALTTTLENTTTRSEPSTITAIGHTWSGIMAGVALTKIPPARNSTTIQESILELNQGVVIASGQDDQGSALFVGGLEINADTGELSGPPFSQAVNRIATRAAISRSY